MNTYSPPLLLTPILFSGHEEATGEQGRNCSLEISTQSRLREPARSEYEGVTLAMCCWAPCLISLSLTSKVGSFTPRLWSGVLGLSENICRVFCWLLGTQFMVASISVLRSLSLFTACSLTQLKSNCHCLRQLGLELAFGQRRTNNTQVEKQWANCCSFPMET